MKNTNSNNNQTTRKQHKTNSKEIPRSLPFTQIASINGMQAIAHSTSEETLARYDNTNYRVKALGKLTTVEFFR